MARWMSERMLGRRRMSRLAVAMAAALVLSSPVAVASAATPPAHLVDAIEQRAARDATELGRPDVATTLQLYTDASAGLPAREVAAIYDRAYDDALARADDGFVERVRDWAPWVVALLALLAAVFRDVLKRWLTVAADAVGQRVWSRIAGSRLMRRTALRRYRTSLARKMRDVHVIFRPNKPLDMARIFVPLKVAGAGLDAKQDALHAVRRHRRIVVVGPPGSGKSILLRHVAYSYASEGAQTGQLVPVWLELHRLSDPRVDPFDELLRAFARSSFPNARQFLERDLEAGGILLLLDGLDEVPSSERPRVAAALGDLLERYPRASAVVTCRDAVYKGELDAQVERTFELMEFSDQQVQTFLASWAPEMPSSKSVDQLVLALRENPRLMVLARNPLMLTIVAHLYTESPTYQLPNSRAEFYEESSDILLRHWHGQQNRFRAADKRAVLRQLALVNQAAHASEVDRRTISTETAIAVVQEVLRDRGKAQEDAAPLLEEIVHRSGLLLSIDAGDRYQFAHLTFQEYFAAEKLLSEPDELLDRYASDPDAWREVVKIWCGLVDNATDMVDRLWASGAELTALEALSDARSVGVATTDRVVNAWIDRLRAGGTDEASERALGALAANLEGRGQRVLSELERVLEAAASPQTAAAAARAIAASCLPAAARILVRSCHAEPVRAPLEQLGDLAVSPLFDRVVDGDRLALESLTAIGTASAAEAIALLMWTADDALAHAAAWRLAALLPNPEVQRGLKQFHPPPRPVEHDWIWAPFADGEDRPLALAVGRAADLIADSSDEQVPERRLSIDPRIALPLCTIGRLRLPARAFARRDIDDELAPAATELARQAGYSWRAGRYPLTTVDDLLDAIGSEPIAPGEQADEPERASGSRGMSPRLLRQVLDVLIARVDAPRSWRYLVASLPLHLQLEVMHGGVRSSVTRVSWTTLNRPGAYSYRTSVHRRASDLIVMAAAAVALAGAGERFLASGTLGMVLATLAGLSLVYGVLWLRLGWAGGIPGTAVGLVLVSPRLLEETAQDAPAAGFTPALAWCGTAGLLAIGLSVPLVVAAWAALLGALSVLTWIAVGHQAAASNAFRGLDLSPAPLDA
jgi:NACHT domain